MKSFVRILILTVILGAFGYTLWHLYEKSQEVPVVFETAKAFRAAMHAQLAEFGRAPASLKVMPAITAPAAAGNVLQLPMRFAPPRQLPVEWLFLA